MGLPTALRVVAYAAQFGFLFLIILFSFVDGLQIALKFKIMFLLLWAAVFTAMSINFMIIEQRDAEQATVNIWGITVNLVSGITSSLRILCIFLWKQAILSVYRRNDS